MTSSTTGDAMLMRLVNDGDTVDVFQTFELGSTGDSLLGVGAQADGKLLGASWANDTFTVIRYEVVICGDGVVHSTEQCDDGNLTNGDGCDQNCTPTACANGIVSAGETCDDANALRPTVACRRASGRPPARRAATTGTCARTTCAPPAASAPT